MGESIEKTGIKPGEITDGKYTVEYGVEQLCGVVDSQIVPAIHTICRTQKKHEKDLHDPESGVVVKVATLEERTAWMKALILLGLGSFVTAVFTLIVAVIIPSLGG